MQSSAVSEAPIETGRERLWLSSEDAMDRAAQAVAQGAVVAQAFGNFYVITTHPSAETVRSVNLLKGRPPNQVGSITTTPLRVPQVYDWSRLPPSLSPADVLGIMDVLWSLGPFGFRGPAAATIPEHLAQMDGDIRTAQIIAPGYACPSNRFLARALAHCGTNILYITSCNLSRHRSGAEDEPAHYRALGVRADFGHDARFRLLEHSDEAAARQAYPLHAPLSTTILAFHKLGEPTPDGRRTMIVERHGSLPVEQVRAALEPLGFAVTLGPFAQKRLAERQYGADVPDARQPLSA